MKQDDKELLLRDLCGRLPYGVKGLLCEDCICTLDRIWAKKGYESVVFAGDYCELDSFKPYLFPLSSLTSSEAAAIERIMGCNFPWYIQYGLLEWTVGGSVESETFELRIEQFERLTEYLNSHHFDYRGLIEKGLAIDATDLNIYKKETK